VVIMALWKSLIGLDSRQHGPKRGSRVRLGERVEADGLPAVRQGSYPSGGLAWIGIESVMRERWSAVRAVLSFEFG
jgi:hypothetical protein